MGCGVKCYIKFINGQTFSHILDWEISMEYPKQICNKGGIKDVLKRRTAAWSCLTAKSWTGKLARQHRHFNSLFGFFFVFLK